MLSGWCTISWKSLFNRSPWLGDKFPSTNKNDIFWQPVATLYPIWVLRNISIYFYIKSLGEHRNLLSALSKTLVDFFNTIQYNIKDKLNKVHPIYWVWHGILLSANHWTAWTNKIGEDHFRRPCNWSYLPIFIVAKHRDNGYLTSLSFNYVWQVGALPILARKGGWAVGQILIMWKGWKFFLVFLTSKMSPTLSKIFSDWAVLSFSGLPIKSKIWNGKISFLYSVANIKTPFSLLQYVKRNFVC